MKLIGMLDSPYVRRVAISLQLLGLPFEHQSLSVFSTFDQFRRVNPVVKAPTLVIHGTVDPLVRPEGGKDTAASIPGAKLLMIEGMGHALPIPMWPEIIDAIDKHAHGAVAKAA